MRDTSHRSQNGNAEAQNRRNRNQGTDVPRSPKTLLFRRNGAAVGVGAGGGGFLLKTIPQVASSEVRALFGLSATSLTVICFTSLGWLPNLPSLHGGLCASHGV